MNKIEALQKKYDALSLAIKQMEKENSTQITIELNDDDDDVGMGTIVYNPSENGVSIDNKTYKSIRLRDATYHHNVCYFPVKAITQLIEALQSLISEE